LAIEERCYINMPPTLKDYTIRFATETDVSELLNVSRQTFIDTFGPHNSKENMSIYVDKVFTLDQMKKELGDANNTFIFAEDGDKIVGYAKLRQGDNPVALGKQHAIEVERIYSIHTYLGKNVGKALMEACLNIARSRGFDVIWLGVWEHNPRAISFYEKWGFEKFGSHPFLVGNDLQTDLMMKKNL
jgi:ribosomal protein S18 acetylase RimI-like enzyme